MSVMLGSHVGLGVLLFRGSRVSGLQVSGKYTLVKSHGLGFRVYGLGFRGRKTQLIIILKP